MNCRQIMEHWLTEHGYDGICNTPMECGCFIGDLFPCDSSPYGCVPGYRVKSNDGDLDFVAIEKPLEADHGQE